MTGRQADRQQWKLRYAIEDKIFQDAGQQTRDRRSHDRDRGEHAWVGRRRAQADNDRDERKADFRCRPAGHHEEDCNQCEIDCCPDADFRGDAA